MAIETLPQVKTEAPIHPYIERRSGVQGGEPVIAGTRITVRIISGWHLMGNSVDEIVAMYDRLNHAKVFDALSYYYDHKDEIEQLRAENDEDVVRRKYEGKL